MYRTAALAMSAFALATPAMAYQAEIRRDDWGIAHIKIGRASCRERVCLAV